MRCAEETKFQKRQVGCASNKAIAPMVLLIHLAVTVGVSGQQLQNIASTISDRLNTGAIERRIAVVDFVDLQGRPGELGRYLAEELSVALTGQPKRFIVIDRTHLQTLLQEHKLSSSGLVDPATARKLGELAGADTLITGTVTPFGDTVRLSVKAIDVRTAAVVTATAGDLPRTKTIDDLLARPASGRSSPEQNAPTNDSNASQTVAQRVSVDGFTFVMQSCRRGGRTATLDRVQATFARYNLSSQNPLGTRPPIAGGDDVTCRLVITNGREDRELLYFGEQVRAFDEIGQEFPAAQVSIANERGRVVSKTLISAVPTAATISFEAIPSTSKTFSSIDVRRSYGRNEGTLSFRNVPILK